ncbi:MAG: hypothetical protein NC332_03615 [Firmicutes bacterium]|nr:hypothetical protein [Bacillota bacterium]
MNDNETNSVRSIRDVREQAESLFADWVQIVDNKSKRTIEDFPYDTGVPDRVEGHCWRCVTVNYCWFANEKDKLPDEFDYGKYSQSQISEQIRGLYHPHCHCKKKGISVPDVERIELITLEKFNDFFTRKKGIFNGMGYTDADRGMFVNLFCRIIKECYVQGKYNVFKHNNCGFMINCLVDLPGFGIKDGRTYYFKSGWIIFPDGKLKANTIHAGWRPRK